MEKNGKENRSGTWTSSWSSERIPLSVLPLWSNIITTMVTIIIITNIIINIITIAVIVNFYIIFKLWNHCQCHLLTEKCNIGNMNVEKEIPIPGIGNMVTSHHGNIINRILYCIDYKAALTGLVCIQWQIS